MICAGTTSCLVCASAAPDSDDSDDPKIDLILRRVSKVLENLTVAAPVCSTVHNQLSLVVVMLGWVKASKGGTMYMVLHWDNLA